MSKEPDEIRIYFIEETSKGLAERYFWSEEYGWQTLSEAKFYTHLDTASEVARKFMMKRPDKSLRVICYVLVETPL